MKTFLSVLFAAIIVVSSASAQDRPAVTAQANTVFAGANGKFEANPDAAFMQFNISAQAETSRAAYDQATSKSAEQVRQILRPTALSPNRPRSDFSRSSRSTTTRRQNAS